MRTAPERAVENPTEQPRKQARAEPVSVLARRYYLDTSGTEEDLLEDLTRIKFIKRLVTRYSEKRMLKERLILNHIIVLYNVFHSDFVLYLLKKSFQGDSWVIVNTFLVYLRRSLDVNSVDPVLLHYLKTRV